MRGVVARSPTVLQPEVGGDGAVTGYVKGKAPTDACAALVRAPRVAAGGRGGGPGAGAGAGAARERGSTKQAAGGAGGATAATALPATDGDGSLQLARGLVDGAATGSWGGAWEATPLLLLWLQVRACATWCSARCNAALFCLGNSPNCGVAPPSPWARGTPHAQPTCNCWPLPCRQALQGAACSGRARALGLHQQGAATVLCEAARAFGGQPRVLRGVEGAHGALACHCRVRGRDSSRPWMVQWLMRAGVPLQGARGVGSRCIGKLAAAAAQRRCTHATARRPQRTRPCRRAACTRSSAWPTRPRPPARQPPWRRPRGGWAGWRSWWTRAVGQSLWCWRAGRRGCWARRVRVGGRMTRSGGGKDRMHMCGVAHPRMHVQGLAARRCAATASARWCPPPCCVQVLELACDDALPGGGARWRCPLACPCAHSWAHARASHQPLVPLRLRRH